MNRIDDIRDVLAMRTPGAFVLVAFFLTTHGIALLVGRKPEQPVWLMLLEWGIAAAAFAGVALLPGDPLPRRVQVGLALAGPVAIGIGYSQLPAPIDGPFQGSFVIVAVTYLGFMCVRGAIAWAWIGFAAAMAVGSAWGIATEQGWEFGAELVLTNIVLLLMATFFGHTIRPTTRSILLLREQSNVRAAGEAAAVAAMEERDRQLARLDAIARPMLDLVGSERRLTPAEQTECRLIEAELRDRLRGNRLVDDDVAAAARAARRRGVIVVLLDDGGLDDADAELTRIVRTTTRATLDRAAAGRIAGRVLPPGRDQLLTIVGCHGETALYIEVTREGIVRSDIDLDSQIGKS